MISFQELHRKTLPEKKRKSVKIDIISYYLWRPICDFLSILLIRTKIKPTTVTVFSFFTALLALISAIIIPNYWGALIAYLFFWLWNISDGIDGNIARYKEQFSKSGDLWDATAGYMAMVSFYFMAGIIASYEHSVVLNNLLPKNYYIIFGAISAICTIFPRLIVQKKSVTYGSESVKKLKDKSSFGLVKILILNINSINGLAGLLLLICILIGVTNLFVICYFVVQVVFALVALTVTLRNLD